MKLLLVFLSVVPYVSLENDFWLSADQVSEIVKLAASNVTSSLVETVAGIQNTFDNILVQVSEDDVTFRFFNNRTTNVNGTVVYSANVSVLSDITDFDTNLNTVFLTHGWNNNCTESPIISILKEAIFAVENVNFFSVCWDDFSNSLYTRGQAAVPQVGNLLGDFIGNISKIYKYSLKKFKVLGHSLGAHISGFAGKRLKGTLSYIGGFDPASPLYSQLLPSNRLDESDAGYVQVIHTAGALLGIPYGVGHADYFPNGGLLQPGCGLDLATTCSHGRSFRYYAESLSRNSNFLSTKCSTYALYLLGTCKDNERSSMGGYNFNTSVVGAYYLKTRSSSPYAIG